MTLTPRRPRPAAATGLAGLLALAVLTGCAQEDPTDDEVTSSTPTVDDDVATSSAPDESVVTSEAPDDSAATSSAPVERGPITLAATDGSFEIEIPGRWEDAIDLVDDESILVAAKDTERIDDFFTNVVVTQEEYVQNLTSAVERTAQELAGEDGEYELLEPAPVDGNRAPGYTLVREVDGVSVHQTQRWVSHDGTLYVVTFSAVESQAEESAPVLDDILASWTWND
ncbi:hypothetical protein GCM10009584_09960 [Ornithinimicrobium humiphilum]|uniref:Lipoprotein LpqN n=1 Tax=Ornithinimicrobium humiphilum TaxID=125288 RepID=A0A543KR01_9MICO|nr:DUF1795 domain-containing protein [Ornithinimicrobium humiphilum]TQM97505.1 hypothetical protein FB476_2418 [Ornithinimicrobium humiphilum]